MIAEAKPAGYWTFISLSWQAAFRAMRRAPLVFGAALIGMIVIGVAFGLLEKLIGKIPSSGVALQIGSGAAEFLAVLLRRALVSLALAPVAVVVHRLIILDDLPGFRGFRRYAEWQFGFLVFALVIQIPDLLFGPAFALKWLMIGIVTIAVLRAALVFPAVAIDGPGGSVKERVEESWRLTTGHLRRFFIVWVGAALPMIIAAAVLLRTPAATAAAATPAKPGLGIAASVIGGVLAVLATAISAAVTSWMYLWVQDRAVKP